MDKEKRLKIATAKLESKKTHRIDLLRGASRMDPNEFDQAILELARTQKIEMVGGDTSAMTDKEIENLLKVDDTIFVNVVWLIPLPAKAYARFGT